MTIARRWKVGTSSLKPYVLRVLHAGCLIECRVNLSIVVDERECIAFALEDCHASGETKYLNVDI